MLTPVQIRSVINGHTQMREHSCFQSAVEMVLKLYNVISLDSYPEQAIVENDGKGFQPFQTTKQYGSTLVSFEETKYEPISQAALDKCVELLNGGIFPVLSLSWPDGRGFHGFIAFLSDKDSLSFITKEQIGKAHTRIYEQADIWPFQAKTEILGVRIVACAAKTI